MVFTPNWNMVLVTGRYVGSNGIPIDGGVTFKPTPARLIDSGALTIIIGKELLVPLNSYGELSVELPCTDDPDITPIEFTYTVVENFKGGATYGIEVPLLYAGIGLDLADADHITPNTGTVLDVTREEFDALVTTVDTYESYDGGFSDSAYAGEVDLGGADGD